MPREERATTIALSPDALYFPLSAARGCTNTLYLINSESVEGKPDGTSTQGVVVFKLRSSAPALFAVHPRMGVVYPNTAFPINISSLRIDSTGPGAATAASAVGAVERHGASMDEGGVAAALAAALLAGGQRDSRRLSGSLGAASSHRDRFQLEVRRVTSAPLLAEFVALTTGATASAGGRPSSKAVSDRIAALWNAGSDAGAPLAVRNVYCRYGAGCVFEPDTAQEAAAAAAAVTAAGGVAVHHTGTLRVLGLDGHTTVAAVRATVTPGGGSGPKGAADVGAPPTRGNSPLEPDSNTAAAAAASSSSVSAAGVDPARGAGDVSQHVRELTEEVARLHEEEEALLDQLDAVKRDCARLRDETAAIASVSKRNGEKMLSLVEARRKWRTKVELVHTPAPYIVLCCILTFAIAFAFRPRSDPSARNWSNEGARVTFPYLDNLLGWTEGK